MLNPKSDMVNLRTAPLDRGEKAGELAIGVILCSSLSRCDTQRIPLYRKSISRDILSAVDVVIDSGATTASWPLSDGTWQCDRRRLLPRLLPFQQDIEQVVLEADVTWEVLVIHA